MEELGRELIPDLCVFAKKPKYIANRADPHLTDTLYYESTLTLLDYTTYHQGYSQFKQVRISVGRDSWHLSVLAAVELL